MSNFALSAPCGCIIQSYDYGKSTYQNELIPCALHGAAPDLLDACRALCQALAYEPEESLKAPLKSAYDAIRKARKP